MGNIENNGTVGSDEPGVNSSLAVLEKGCQPPSRDLISSLHVLNKKIPLENAVLLKDVVRTFPMKIPLYYFSLIKDLSDINDPIRKQCVPSIEEIKENAYDSIDPLHEEEMSPFPCLVHRYPDRVLLIVANKCFMYCRHCTRKRIWKNKMAEPSLKEIETALNYVYADRKIREVVISGGDPFTLGTEKLDYILSLVAKRGNIEVIRIGTRAPVVFPQRIDRSLCGVLERYDNLWINVQFNHPRAVTPESARAWGKLQ